MTTYIGKPFSKDIPPIPHSNLLFDDTATIAILLEHDALFLLAISHCPCLFYRLPPGERTFKPVLPMIVYRRSKDDHDGELCEEDTVEDEGLGFVPCFEALRNDVAARVYYERGETGRGNRRELHDGEGQVGSNAGRGSRTWVR